MRLSIRHVSSFFACLLLLSLYIAGCGSATSSTDSMTLKVAQNSSAPSYFPLYIAEKENYFKDQGLTLDPSPPLQFGTGPKTTVAVEANNVELAAGVITDVFTLSRIDSSVKLLGMLTSDLDTDIIVSKRFTQQTGLTEASPLADKIKALVGKRIGVTGFGAATDAFLVYLFRQQGLDAHKDTVVVNMGSNNTAAGLAALQSGRVDALSFPVPAGQEASLQGIGSILLSTDSGHNDIAALQGMATGVIYAKQSVINAKPKAVAAFIRAIAQAEDFIQKNPDQAKTLLEQYARLKPKDANVIATTLMASFVPSPQISQASFNASVQFHVQGGLLAVAPPYQDLVATSTINSALSGLAHTS